MEIPYFSCVHCFCLPPPIRHFSETSSEKTQICFYVLLITALYDNMCPPEQRLLYKIL